MKDFLIKAISHNKQVCAYAAKTIEEARRRHDMLSVASVVLGRSMTAGVILGAIPKGEVRGYDSDPYAYAGLLTRFTLYRVKAVRILPLICMQNKSPPLLL